MTTLIIDGYIVKEKTDDGRMFLYTAMPGDQCFDIDLPIKNLLSTDIPAKCKITIEIEN